MYKKYIKRILDFIFALIGIIVTSPILLILYILVIIFMGFPAIFKQERPGKDEKIFKLYKFRTMTNKKDANGKLLPDADRLTKFGKFLRKTSLDELPEFFNILVGQMSFIGPRPLTVSYLKYYTKEEHHRHDVLPGLTGWAQVNGRNGLQWEERFAYDLEYIKNMSFKNDVKIVFMTIKKVLAGSDVTVRGTGKVIDFDKYRREQNESNR